LINIQKQELESNDFLSYRFPDMYQSFDTDWQKIDDAYKWALKFRDVVLKQNPQTTFVERVCTSLEYSKSIQDQKSKLLSIFSIEESASYIWFSQSFDESRKIHEMCFSELASLVSKCNVNLDQLEEWIDYNSIRIECNKNGLSRFLDLASDNNLNQEFLIPVYKKRFFSLWLDSVLTDFKSVQNFKQRDQDYLIKEFAKLDRLQFDINKLRVKGQLINTLPTFTRFTKGFDEVSILKRELKKQRKIMPIRKLFKEIPNLLLELKPCLMMSPLSVSLFLEADTYKFDLVIFDEASQVFTENAIGAISRGNQVIIVGDSKQLPPTNFFQQTVTQGDYDSTEDELEENIDVYESILDEANMLPEKTLLWHYRSRHESLIAFSNAHVYKNRLITFPSNIDSSPNTGIEYVYIPDGYYDRGGRKGNIIEAKKVAELVFEHFEKTPEKSLGVITFGEVQQNAIDSELRMMRLKDQTKENFFNENNEEPFFIKSLENVQGDERDTIIFSIGYAKDVNGKFWNQFGPLSRAGGERRLNVAITRAKYNIKLVGSILPTDIVVDNIKFEGPKLLREYLDYAINTSKQTTFTTKNSNIIEPISSFEDIVSNFLEEHGYLVAKKVGCSDFRIDIAVKHPNHTNTFVLGIECDGPSYSSANTARDRDRLRQEVLENMGWNLYRIWSTEWIKNTASEEKRLLHAVEKAISMHNCESGLYNYFDSKTLVNSANDKYIEIKDYSEDDTNPVLVYDFSKLEEYNFNDLPRYDGYLD
jgi:hypothetical protein